MNPQALNPQALKQPPLRILHLTLGADAGGLSRYIIDLSAALRQQGHQVEVAGDTGAWQWAFQQAQIPYHVVPLKSGLMGFWRSVRTLNGLLRDRPFDLLHTHYRRATLLARRLSPLRPILYTLHLSHISLRWPRRWLTDFGDHTLVASEDARRWMTDEARVPRGRLSLIPHGIRPERFPLADDATRRAARRELGLNEHDRVALYVGRLDWPKNEGWLLDLAASARGRIPHLKVLLVGEGPHDPQLRARVARDGLGNTVRLYGHQDPLPFYQSADALLLPSQREGFSLVCAEAMSVGVPVLRTRTSGTHELIVEGVTGRSVAIDHDAFLSASIQFLSDPPALRQMGSAAAAHVRNNLTFERQVDETLRLYRSLTGTH